MNKPWTWCRLGSVFHLAWKWFAGATDHPAAEWTMDPREVELCPRTGRYLELGQGDA